MAAAEQNNIPPPVGIQSLFELIPIDMLLEVAEADLTAARALACTSRFLAENIARNAQIQRAILRDESASVIARWWRGIYMLGDFCEMCHTYGHRDMRGMDLQWFERDGVSGCRLCLSFCERCMENRLREQVTWFEHEGPGGFSACEECWTPDDDSRHLHSFLNGVNYENWYNDLRTLLE